MPSGARVLDIAEIVRPNILATAIANDFQSWEMFRNAWLTEKKEIRNYLFARDTSATTTSTLPWKNSTHIPKLCQLRDNLQANYMAAIFPNDEYLIWEGDDESSQAKEKRLIIESYMENKLRQSAFRTEIAKCLNDYIDYGNCFAMTEFVAEESDDPTTKEKIPGYVGPKLVRISPLDIVFNPTAASFDESPKIVRSLRTLGSLHADILDHPEQGYLSEVFDLVVAYRQRFNGLSQGDFAKTEAYQIDGFASWINYFQSNYVELLDFYGDYYDPFTKEFQKNRIITIVDRSHVIRNVPNPSWLGKPNIFHCGWRLRPDNLYAMGPLDNLVGMQYRIDHLENAKADAIDLVIHPITKVKGFVEDFDYGPGTRLYCGDEGDVEFMRTDLNSVVQADNQIAMYEQKMEEMAGAPKQAMGFRTPGEKTAYEVQILENGANRIFLNKTSYFEEAFMEPAIQSMLEISRRNMGPSDLVRVLDDSYGVVSFMTITREDIAAKGKIRPIGARHFARNANIIQNLTNFANSSLGQDPSVNVHISGKKLAHLIEDLMNLNRYQLVQDNIRVAEQLETGRLQAAAQQIIHEETTTPQMLGGQGGQPQMGATPQNGGGPPGLLPNAVTQHASS